MTILLAACTGALGALGRWRLDRATQRALVRWSDPLATKSGIVIVNILGCLLAGALTHLLSGSVLTVVSGGFLGGFTTFSTATLDALTLWEEGHHLRALGVALGTWALCLVAVWVGARLAAANM